MRTVILDYDAGNLTSVQRACAHLGHETRIVRDPAEVDAAERVIFPGVGAAAQCMGSLQALGLAGALRRAIDAGKPVLAICVGLQLLFEHSEEDGGVPCLGILPGRHLYFVHSYYAAPGAGVQVVAESQHGIRFCAGVRRGNLAAFQFHPEKSGAVGLALLRNFLG